MILKSNMQVETLLIFQKSIKKNLVGKHKHHSMLLWQQVLNKLSVTEIKMKILVVSLFLDVYKRQVSIARDIKDAFDHVVLHAGAYHDIVRLSIGVAGIRDEETIQDLLNKCDQRMYISKRDGKHRITY